MPSRQLSSPNHNPTLLFLTLTLSFSLLLLAALVYLLYHFYSSFPRRSRTLPFDSPSSSLLHLQKFSYKELKSATNDFCTSNSIGKGGSGTVFRGILRDGKLVAVKTLDTTSFQNEREFQNEVEVLGNLDSKSPFIVSLLGFCVYKNMSMLVYEYMPNRSLQESLFGENSRVLDWERRFEIVLDVSRALEFLHVECDPPVIHGDVKPGNVLLDWEYRAKLSDFGLSRVKNEGEFGVVDMFSQELSGNLAGGGGETPGIGTPAESCSEVDFALALQASCSSKNGGIANLNAFACSSNNNNNNNSNVGRENYGESRVEKGKEVSIWNFENGDDWNKGGTYDDEIFSADHSKELRLSSESKQWGKDWWWKQDGSGELCSKDYVMEWIGSQICATVNADWDEEKKTSPENSHRDNFVRLDIDKEANENQLQEPRTKKHRKMQEWWKEEYLDEISKKTSGNKLKRIEAKYIKKGFRISRFDLIKRCKSLKRRKFGNNNRNGEDPKLEFSLRRGWKNKNSRSGGSELWSGDLFSREVSSTTSMRGTLCYVAPEYGGCGYLMEKADIYSLGVLILVIVSGRRPLHVLSSPMKLEKANLISWCRQLAHSGNILDLVDQRLKEEYNKEQASLCINLALACLQKMPELRPDIGEIVKILRGEMDLPPLPFEFSPSPPSKLFSKSRRKQKANAD